MMNLKRSLAYLSFVLFSPSVFSMTNGVEENCIINQQCYQNSFCSHPYIDLGVGWAFVKNPNAQVTNANDLPDIYLSNNNKDNIFLAISAGYAWFFNKAWLPAASLGIEYSAVPEINSTGQIEQFADPDLINYNYSYKVSRQQLTLLGKLDIYRAGQFMPFILAGIGNSWSRFSNYQESPLPGVFPRVSPNFSNKTNSDVSYTLGVGLDYQPLDYLILDLAYRYDHFGKVNSGNGDDFSNLLNLTTDHLHTDTIVFNMRYLFG